MASPLSLLFDLSFTEFITTRVIKILFVLSIIFGAIFTLILIVVGLLGGPIEKAIALLLSPVLFLIYVLMLRLWCEFIIVVFHIAENTGRLVDQGRSQGASASTEQV